MYGKKTTTVKKSADKKAPKDKMGKEERMEMMRMKMKGKAKK